ncbi:MAG: AmmeMemoRadiSam system radical SAM enzyme, partial [Nanoarchaeota archaeon]|nr:AmmeMemoRadiSam system radical SAM enzyme [Nanoarchaeota archaeon]
MKTAMLWHNEKNSIRCDLCARRCLIAEGRSGVCLVRKNIKNILYSLNYGKIIAMNPDHIEKKPLFHFLPGTKAFSIASAGCNFACAYCCNWEI